MRRPDEVMHTVVNFLKEESAAPLIEYVLIGSLIATVFGLVVLTFGKVE